MADKNTANIGFEKQIWDAACVLRGNMDASEYKNVVLGLIFLKYISDRFDDKYQELVEEGDGFEEDIDEYTSEGIFFVPGDARWSEIAAKAHTPEIGTVIDNAMRAIEKENKRLKDILIHPHPSCSFFSSFTIRPRFLAVFMKVGRWSAWVFFWLPDGFSRRSALR